MERGEFKTMRAAAIAAGIVNARTALDKLRSDWKQATPEERSAFLEEVAACTAEKASAQIRKTASA